VARRKAKEPHLPDDPARRALLVRIHQLNTDTKERHLHRDNLAATIADHDAAIERNKADVAALETALTKLTETPPPKTEIGLAQIGDFYEIVAGPGGEPRLVKREQ
jgi:hypothetical protein